MEKVRIEEVPDECGRKEVVNRKGGEREKKGKREVERKSE